RKARSPPNGIFAGEQRARGRLVEEEDGLSVVVVLLRGQPPAHETDAEGFEVAGSDHEPVRTGAVPRVGLTPVDVEAPVPGIDGQGQARGRAGHAHAGHRADLREELAVERADVRALAV